MANHDRQPRFQPLDGGWGWVVVAASFFAVFLLSTCIISFSILYDEFRTTFDMSRSLAGWIGSVQLALAFVNSIPTGVLVQRFGCRPVCIIGFFIASIGLGSSFWATSYVMLFVTYGIITGFGLGLSMLPVFVCVHQYFDKRRAVAVGIALCGINLSSFITGPLMRFLVDTYTWRGACLLHAGAMLHGILCACALRPLKKVKVEEDVNTQNKRRNCCQNLIRLFDFSLLKEKRYVLYIVGNFCVNFSGMTYHQHLVSFGILQGVSESCAAFLPTILGVCSTVARIISGFIGDHKMVNRRFMCATFALIGGFVVSFSFLGTSFPAIATLCGIFGICSGAFTTVQFTVLVDLVGVARIAQAQAFFSAFMGSSSLFSGPLAGIVCLEILTFPFYPRMCWERPDGFLADKTGDYDLPFFLNGLVHVAGGAIILVVGYLHQVHMNATANANGHITRNGLLQKTIRGKSNEPEQVELIITSV